MRIFHRLELQSGLKTVFFVVILLSSLLIFGISTSFTQELVQTDEKTFDFKSGSTLLLTLDVGNVEISTWDQDKIHIRLRKWVDAGSRDKAQELMEKLQVEFIQQRDVFEIRQLKQGSGNPFSRLLKITGLKKSASSRIDFILRVPNRLKLQIIKNEGIVIVDSLTGSINLKQKTGELQLNSIFADKIDLDLDEVETKIVNLKGNISTKTNVAVSSNKGNLIFQDCRIGKLVARLKNSDCFLIGNSISNCDFESKTGDIFFRPVDYNQSFFNISTKKGDVFFLISESPLCQVFLETGLGMIKSEHPWDIIKSGSGFSVNLEKTDSNTGKIVIITDFGDIFIKKNWESYRK